MPAEDLPEDQGPPTSPPTTSWPMDLDAHGPEEIADDEDGHSVPADLLELHEVLEFQAAVEAEAQR